MDLPEYIGTVHPEKWLKQIQTYCYLKDITDKLKILGICKFKICSSINIPNDINTLDKLIKALKSHSTFTIFKNSCKRKLQVMKYIPEEESNYTATFLANFRSLCDDAEINDPEEIKHMLFNAYSSNEFFQNEFIKRVIGINLVEEIFKIFNEVVFEELNIIKKGTFIALKHVATGKYLSSCNINYQTGSKSRIVFAGEKLPGLNANALWTLYFNNSNKQKEAYQSNKIFYGDTIYLYHKIVCNSLYFNYAYRSPTTGHVEVNCGSGNNYFLYLENTNTTNNNTPYIKNKDIITLKTGDNYILRSHDVTFAIGDKTFQEVVGHKERIGGNDEWQIEIVLT